MDVNDSPNHNEPRLYWQPIVYFSSNVGGLSDKQAGNFFQ